MKFKTYLCHAKHSMCLFELACDAQQRLFISLLRIIIASHSLHNFWPISFNPIIHCRFANTSILTILFMRCEKCKTERLMSQEMFYNEHTVISRYIVSKKLAYVFVQTLTNFGRSSISVEGSSFVDSQCYTIVRIVR